MNHNISFVCPQILSRILTIDNWRSCQQSGDVCELREGTCDASGVAEGDVLQTGWTKQTSTI